jgi:hypothetical protein
MVGSDEDRGRSRRLGAEDRGWSSTSRVLGSWMIERSGDVVCSLHHTQGDDEHVFLVVLLQNHSLGFSIFGLKTGNYGLVI